MVNILTRGVWVGWFANSCGGVTALSVTIMSKLKKLDAKWKDEADEFDKKFSKLRAKIWREIKKDRTMNIIDLSVIIYLVWRLSTGSRF